jgi:hypothetical protein
MSYGVQRRVWKIGLDNILHEENFPLPIIAAGKVR